MLDAPKGDDIRATFWTNGRALPRSFDSTAVSLDVSTVCTGRSTVGQEGLIEG